MRNTKYITMQNFGAVSVLTMEDMVKELAAISRQKGEIKIESPILINPKNQRLEVLISYIKL